MKREMYTICNNVDGITFDKLYKLCKILYPKHKMTAYRKKNRKYVLEWNLTKNEYIFLCKIYEKQEEQ